MRRFTPEKALLALRRMAAPLIPAATKPAQVCSLVVENNTNSVFASVEPDNSQVQHAN